MPGPMKWQKWEEELVLAMTRDGKQPTEILEHLPARSLGSLQTYMTREGLFHLAPPPAVRPKERAKTAAIRKCMCCRRNFGSEWIGNRICTRCKETGEYKVA